MRHPRDYSVDETWIVFQVNEEPVRAGRDGDFDVICLMDAASCFLFGGEFIPTGAAEVPEAAVEALFEKARVVHDLLSEKLIVSSGLAAAPFLALAEREGMQVECVPDEELTIFLSGAREGFREHMARGDDGEARDG